MRKYDEHGFYTYEWAEANVPGFSELDPCCQQQVLLFPEMPVVCLPVVRYTPPIPSFDAPPEGQLWAGLVVAPEYGALPQAVPAPAGGLLLLLGLAALALLRIRR